MRTTNIFGSCLLVIGLLMPASSTYAQVSIGNDGVAFPDGTLQTTGIPGTYAIGDRGPADGFVFYVTADGLHGLEAAPVDQSAGTHWGCYGFDIPGADGTVIGTGSSNTEAILQSCTTAGIAAILASEYVSPSGYLDWYLPSKEELRLMYNTIGPGGWPIPNVGRFDTGIYWSSSEDGAVKAWLAFFSSGSLNSSSKGGSRRVRAVRAF